MQRPHSDLLNRDEYYYDAKIQVLLSLLPLILNVAMAHGIGLLSCCCMGMTRWALVLMQVSLKDRVQRCSFSPSSPGKLWPKVNSNKYCRTRRADRTKYAALHIWDPMNIVSPLRLGLSQIPWRWYECWVVIAFTTVSAPSAEHADIHSWISPCRSNRRECKDTVTMQEREGTSGNQKLA